MFFRRSGTKKEQYKESEAIKRFATRCIRAQIKTCDWLGDASEKLTLKQKQVTLFLFCGLSLAVCSAIIVRTISSKQDFVMEGHVRLPTHIGKATMKSNAVISPQTFARVEQMKKQLDSIKSYNPGYYNILIKQNPFLKDSILIFEKKYHSNIK